MKGLLSFVKRSFKLKIGLQRKSWDMKISLSVEGIACNYNLNIIIINSYNGDLPFSSLNITCVSFKKNKNGITNYYVVLLSSLSVQE